jgi:hypothetical protein
MQVPELLAARDGAAVQARGTAIEEQAQADRIDATPTLLAGPTGGKLSRIELSSPTDLAAIEAAIAKAQS